MIVLFYNSLDSPLLQQMMCWCSHTAFLLQSSTFLFQTAFMLARDTSDFEKGLCLLFAVFGKPFLTIHIDGTKSFSNASSVVICCIGFIIVGIDLHEILAAYIVSHDLDLLCDCNCRRSVIPKPNDETVLHVCIVLIHCTQIRMLWVTLLKIIYVILLSFSSV